MTQADVDKAKEVVAREPIRRGGSRPKAGRPKAVRSAGEALDVDKAIEFHIMRVKDLLKRKLNDMANIEALVSSIEKVL